MLFEYNGVKKECETVLDVKKFHSMTVDQLILDGWCIDYVLNESIYFMNGEKRLGVSLWWCNRKRGTFIIVDYSDKEKLHGETVFRIDFARKGDKIISEQEA